MFKKPGKSLLVLAYSSNTCYTSLSKLRDLEIKAKRMSDVDPKELKIDFKKRTWSYLNWENIAIGRSRSDIFLGNQDKWGVIGVYDHSIPTHVERIMCDSQKAVERGVSLSEG